MKQYLTRKLIVAFALCAGIHPIFAQSTIYPVAEAVVRDGSNFNLDLNEANLGYLMVKNGVGSAGKAYFKFDFTGQNPNTNNSLVFNFRTYTASARQHPQIWALNQSYPSFTGSVLVWSSAQANETNSGSMLTNPTNTFTAAPLVDFISPGTANVSSSVTIPAPWGSYLVDGQLVLVVTSPFTDPTNQSNGLRLQTNNTFLTFQALSGAPPTVGMLTNQTIGAGQTSPTQFFAVSDAEDSADALFVSALSSSELVVPSANIVPGGAGKDRSIYVIAGSTPGVATITVSVSDTAGNISQRVFRVTVLPLDYAPVISTPLSTNTLANTPLTVPFTVGDVETPAPSLVVAGDVATYSGSILASVLVGGAGSNRTVTVTPAPNADGVGVVNISVTDEYAQTTTTSFAVMVRPSSNVVFIDHFDYPDGKLFVNSASFWVRRNAAAQSVNLMTATQQANIRPKGSSDDGAAGLAGAPYVPGTGAVLYTTFTATWYELDVFPAVTNSVGSFLQLLNTSNATSLAVSEIGTTTNTTAEGYFRLGLIDRLGAFNDYVGANLPVPSGIALTTARVATRYDVDTGTSTLWVDSASEAAPGAISIDSLTPATISYVGLRQDLGMGYIYLDDLKVTLAVKPVITQIIPAAAGTFELFFTGGPGDVPASFAIQFAPGVTGAFMDSPGASITFLGGHAFKASVPASGEQGFFRIRRLPVTF